MSLSMVSAQMPAASAACVKYSNNSHRLMRQALWLPYGQISSILPCSCQACQCKKEDVSESPPSFWCARALPSL